MSRHVFEGAERFRVNVEADRKAEDLFKDLYVDFDEERDSVTGLRRRRRRASNTPNDPVKTVSLIEQDGVLYWRDGIPALTSTSSFGPGRRRGRPTVPDGSLVFAKEFPVLAPNKVVEGIGKIDRRLNPAILATLCSQVRALRQDSAGVFLLDKRETSGPFKGRTLLFVHGTFSNANNMLAEFEATPRGSRFLNRVMRGARKYDQVVFFEHPTLSVSPIINALELGRVFAGSTGQIDIIAHSRGGLIVRWWLEAFGSSLALSSGTPARAILAGAPLHGTSLAAPDKLQNAMSLLSNVGTFAAATMKLASPANPFLWVGGKLIEVIVSVTGALAKTPLVDALVTLVPGLSGQSAVNNNLELNRLRLGPCAVEPLYYAITSNFETRDPGWKFWRNFRKDRMGDLAADVVFPGANDLVVDTWSMTEFGVPKLKLAGSPCDHGNSETVWHCNYFRQDKTINYIAAKLGIAVD